MRENKNIRVDKLDNNDLNEFFVVMQLILLRNVSTIFSYVRHVQL